MAGLYGLGMHHNPMIGKTEMNAHSWMYVGDDHIHCLICGLCGPFLSSLSEKDLARTFIGDLPSKCGGK